MAVGSLVGIFSADDLRWKIGLKMPKSPARGVAMTVEEMRGRVDEISSGWRFKMFGMGGDLCLRLIMTAEICSRLDKLIEQGEEPVTAADVERALEGR